MDVTLSNFVPFENSQSLILRALDSFLSPLFIFSPTFKHLISALWPSLSWAVDSFRQQGGELMYDVIIVDTQQQPHTTQHQTTERSHVWEQLSACLRRVM